MYHQTRLGVYLFALFILALSLVPAAAQDSPPLITLYDGNNRQLVQIAADGSQTIRSLGLPDDVHIGAGLMAFTPDASRVAFCYTRYATTPAANQTRLIIRDLVAQSNLVEHDLGSTLSCQTSRASFNDDYTRLAYGILNYTQGMPGADTSRPAWQLHIIDTTTGAALATLDQSAEVTLGSGFPSDILPLVRAFTGSTVIFNAVPFGTDATIDVPVFAWDSLTGAVTPLAAPHFSSIAAASFAPTGEVAYQAEDLALPSAEPFGPTPRWNVILHQTASTAESRRIYHNPAELILDVAFIDDGARLGLVLMPQIDWDNPQPPPLRWVALDRAGNLTNLGGGASVYADIFSLPAGYGILSVTATNPQGTEYASTLTVAQPGSQPITLWSSPTAGWEVAHAAPATQPAPDLAPFIESQ